VIYESSEKGENYKLKMYLKNIFRVFFKEICCLFSLFFIAWFKNNIDFRRNSLNKIQPICKQTDGKK